MFSRDISFCIINLQQFDNILATLRGNLRENFVFQGSEQNSLVATSEFCSEPWKTKFSLRLPLNVASILSNCCKLMMQNDMSLENIYHFGKGTFIQRNSKSYYLDATHS